MTGTGTSYLATWKQLATPSFLGGVVGLALCALGIYFDPQQLVRSYLVANLYWLSLGLGCLVLLMLQYVTGGRWGLVLRRILEAGSKTLLVSLVLFAPLAFGLHQLYTWTDLEAYRHEEALYKLLRQKELYLNIPFFLIRTAFYFSAWIGLTLLLTYLSNQYEKHPVRPLRQRMRRVSALGLALYGLTVTFAGIDWVMSLEPTWFSSIFGVVTATAQLLPALAFATLVLVWLSSRPPVSEAMSPLLWNDLGNLLLAFVMLWAYIGYSQYFLIWSGNLPEEITWYLHRTEGVWGGISLLLIFAYFVLPFLLLLSSHLKQDPHRLVRVAGLILVMHYVYQFWLVMPAPEVLYHGPEAAHGRPFFPHWLDAAALVGVGGIWVSGFLWFLQSRPLLPEYDLKALEPDHAHQGHKVITPEEAQHGQV